MSMIKRERVRTICARVSVCTWERERKEKLKESIWLIICPKMIFFCFFFLLEFHPTLWLIQLCSCWQRTVNCEFNQFGKAQYRNQSKRCWVVAVMLPLHSYSSLNPERIRDQYQWCIGGGASPQDNSNASH